MKVFFYSGMQKLIEKSGVGKAAYHQLSAAEQNNIGIAHGLEDADIVHINTVFPRSFWLAKKSPEKRNSGCVPCTFYKGRFSKLLYRF